MKVRIQKLDEMAQIPKYAKQGDAGMDLVAISRVDTPEYVEYGTGLAIEIPEGYVGLLFPRSSISKHDMVLANSVGVVDSGYRGEVKLRFKVQKTPDGLEMMVGGMRNPLVYGVSDKVGQLIIMPYPKIVWEVTEDLSETARGAGGFGSSGQ